MLAPFPQAIYKQKYAWPGEEWSDTAWRVATTVLGALGYSQESKEVRKVFEYIRDRKFIPGGRYLYATGRRLHQTQNCLLIRAEDSREGWADIVWKSAMALQTGAGIGIDYSDIRHRGAPIVGTGGVASGPVELMKMVNEIGRGVMQGGSRRSAIWAGLNWNHSDADEFIDMKNWSEEVRAAKAKDFNAPGTMDMTNISIGLDDDFFEAINNPEHADHAKAKTRYKKVIRQMFTTAEPGFSVNLGSKRRETLRNAPVCAETLVFTMEGYRPVDHLVGREVMVWTGWRWAKTTFKCTGLDVPTVKVAMSHGASITCDPTHPFLLTDGSRVAAGDLTPGTDLLVSNPVMPGMKPGQWPVQVVSVTPAKNADVFCCDVGVEEHSFMAEGVIISNCTEVTSEDDSDICNLGSFNLARIDSIEEFKEIVRYGTLFLLAGSVYSDVPYPEVAETRTKNRRLGAGLMGVHEWLLKRGLRYEPSEALALWLKEYCETTKWSYVYAREHKLSAPIATRAIAPTGCQRPDTLVVTEDGILELGELGRADGEQWQDLGLEVAQEDGRSKRATRFFVNGVADTKRVTLSSGAVLEATPNHQYRCLVGADYVWRRSDELRPGDLVVVALNTYTKTTEPALQPVRKWYRTENVAQFPTHMSPDLAEFLGLFFADGSIHAKGIRIACNAREPASYAHVTELGQRLFGITATLEDNGRNCMSVCFNSSMLLRWLYVNNLDKPECTQMELPVVIRCASRESLSRFLAGYWLADGSESNSAQYIDTSSPKLAQQLLAVIRALGSDAAIQHTVSGMGTAMYRVRWVKTMRRCVTKDVRARLDAIGLPSCVVDAVESIENSRSMTLDIEVPDTVTYVANGVVSHNTIAIIGETTSGIEPIFCVAYKRRYLANGKDWKFQYVIDPTARRLIDSGVDPESIEDAYSLSYDIERRVAMQAWLQEYVDQAISSTINMPAWGTDANNESTLDTYGDILLKYLPRLRGITVYPDGCRGGQPLVPVAYAEAAGKEGVVFEESEERCVGGACGV